MLWVWEPRTNHLSCSLLACGCRLCGASLTTCVMVGRQCATLRCGSSRAQGRPACRRRRLRGSSRRSSPGLPHLALVQQRRQQWRHSRLLPRCHRPALRQGRLRRQQLHQRQSPSPTARVCPCRSPTAPAAAAAQRLHPAQAVQLLWSRSSRQTVRPRPPHQQPASLFRRRRRSRQLQQLLLYRFPHPRRSGRQHLCSRHPQCRRQHRCRPQRPCSQQQHPGHQRLCRSQCLRRSRRLCSHRRRCGRQCQRQRWDLPA